MCVYVVLMASQGVIPWCFGYNDFILYHVDAKRKVLNSSQKTTRPIKLKL